MGKALCYSSQPAQTPGLAFLRNRATGKELVPLGALVLTIQSALTPEMGMWLLTPGQSFKVSISVHPEQAIAHLKQNYSAIYRNLEN